MASLRKNTAGQNFTFGLVNVTTGGALTGATVSVFVTKDNGAQAAGGGTVTEAGNGQYNYAPTQAETNAVDVGFHLGASGAIPVNIDFHTDDPSTAQIGVNVVNFGSTAVTGRDIGASVLVSYGTGAGQINLTGGNLAGAVPSVTSIVSANVTQVTGSAVAATNMAISAEDVGRGSCAAGGTVTSVPTSVWTLGGAGNVADQFAGRVIIFDFDTPTIALQGQGAVITANTAGATPTFTVAATSLTTAPAAGDTFSVF